jgi:hypothetical protein
MTPPNQERGERLSVMLTRDELEAINDFRFRARMPNLAAAVRELLRRGLASATKQSKD